MLETSAARPALGDQVRLVGDTLRQSLSHPTTLLYPALKSVLTVALVAVLVAGLLLPIGSAIPIGLPTMLVAVAASVALLYVLGPVLAVGLDVAYCYELHELRRGARPTPGSGLVFAARRLPKISLGAMAVSGTFLAGYVSNTGSLRVGSGVLDVLLAPALVTEDGSVGDLVAHIESVASDQWGNAVIAVYGVGTLARALGTLSIVGGVSVVAGHWAGLLPGVTTIWLALAVAVVLFLGGLAVSTFCKSLVDGPVAMALYEQATTGEEPSRGPLDADSVREVR